MPLHDSDGIDVNKFVKCFLSNWFFVRKTHNFHLSISLVPFPFRQTSMKSTIGNAIRWFVPAFKICKERGQQRHRCVPAMDTRMVTFIKCDAYANIVQAFGCYMKAAAPFTRFIVPSVEMHGKRRAQRRDVHSKSIRSVWRTIGRWRIRLRPFAMENGRFTRKSAALVSRPHSTAAIWHIGCSNRWERHRAANRRDFSFAATICEPIDRSTIWSARSDIIQVSYLERIRSNADGFWFLADFPVFFFFLLDLRLKSYGRCEIPRDVCPEKLKHLQVSTPVCGSDNYSYTSFDALLCARYRMNKSEWMWAMGWIDSVIKLKWTRKGVVSQRDAYLFKRLPEIGKRSTIDSPGTILLLSSRSTWWNHR